MPRVDDHYKPFLEVFEKETNEEHRPSLKRKPRQDKGLPFYPSVQHVKNTEMMLQYEECTSSVESGGLSMHSLLMWDATPRLFRSSTRHDGHGFHKISQLQWTNTKAILFSEAHGHLHILFIREWLLNTDEFYSQCESCSKKSKIPNVKAQRKIFYYFVSGIWSCLYNNGEYPGNYTHAQATTRLSPIGFTHKIVHIMLLETSLIPALAKIRFSHTATWSSRFPILISNSARSHMHMHSDLCTVTYLLRMRSLVTTATRQ